jgi:glycosyltransferase involved in cell wall biosynthesis
MTTATEIACNCLSREFDIALLDIADKRDLSNVGKLEIRNIFLALKHAVEFWILLWKRNPEIVYIPIAQHALPFLRDCLFLIPSRLAGRKTIIHLHGGYFGKFWEGSGPIMRAVVRFALGRAARAIVLGECLRNLFDGVVSRERVVAIPNGIPDFASDIVGNRSNAPTMIYLGALMKSKGVLDLLSALPAVREQIPEVQLILTGEWFSQDDHAAAMETIRKNRLESCVRFTGPKGAPEKYDLYRAADVFVLPTFYPNEGHPYTILEAMCAGLPVVSTNVGCIPETVLDGETGYIIPKHDITVLSLRLITLFQDSDLRSRMGQAARRRYEELYSDRRFTERLIATFHEVHLEEAFR